MGAKVVIGRIQYGCDVDFKQRLPRLVRFLNIAVVHVADARFGCCKLTDKVFYEGDLFATALLRIAGGREVQQLDCKPEGETRLVVARPVSGVEEVALAQTVRTAYIQGLIALTKQVDAADGNIVGGGVPACGVIAISFW